MGQKINKIIDSLIIFFSENGLFFTLKILSVLRPQIMVMSSCLEADTFELIDVNIKHEMKILLTRQVLQPTCKEIKKINYMEI